MPPRENTSASPADWQTAAPTEAEAAYKELLSMPAPQSALDFRRAIAMAVLIGRQLESELAVHLPTNSPNPPNL